MEQGTVDWLEWRRGGIGSSDAPIIMKVSPFKTPYQLWEEKLGIKREERDSLYILDKGQQIEKKARALFEITHGVKAPPATYTDETLPFLRASLDGKILGKNEIIEIKMQGLEQHERVFDHQVPEKYIYQIMHQLYVTKASHCFFISYCEKARQKMGVTKVLPNKTLMDELIEQEKQFWELIQRRTPPELLNKDFKTIRIKGKTKEIRELHDVFRDYENAKKAYLDKKKYFTEGLPDDSRMILDGHRIYREGDLFKIDFRDNESFSGLPILGELWNKHVTKLPKIRGCNGQRTRFAKNRWKENPDKDYWVEIIKKLEASKFCTGHNSNGWKASFDFFIRPESHFKILEGKYDDEHKGESTNIEDILNG